MGFYSSHVLPKLLTWAMSQEAFAEQRATLCPQAQGTVLEIGFGSGLNAPFYQNIERLLSVEPARELLDIFIASGIGSEARHPITLLQASAEQLPLAADCVDTIVMSWTLCSIPNPALAVAEMARVLRGGGKLLFIEHGLSDSPRTRRWQRRLTPLWRRVGGGCHLDRAVDQLLEQHGFTILTLRRWELPDFPSIFSHQYCGVASKP